MESVDTKILPAHFSWDLTCLSHTFTLARAADLMDSVVEPYECVASAELVEGAEADKIRDHEFRMRQEEVKLEHARTTPLSMFKMLLSMLREPRAQETLVPESTTKSSPEHLVPYQDSESSDSPLPARLTTVPDSDPAP